MIIFVASIIVLFHSSVAFSENSDSNEIVVINTTTTKGYETLDAAVIEANDGEEVEIIVAGTYVVDSFRTGFYVPNHITISASDSLGPESVILDGICNEPEGLSDYPIFPALKGVDFKNLTLDVGNHSYHGFWNATQSINFNKCKIKGWFWTSQNTTFTNCNFFQEVSDYYCVYTYYGNKIIFDGCYFNAYGRFVNVYKDDTGSKTDVIFNNCQFESNEKHKSAINVKASDGLPLQDHMLQWNVVISGCSTIGDNFPTDNRLNSPLVMIDDGNSPAVYISVSDSSGNLKKIYPPPPQYLDLTVGSGGQLHTALKNEFETLIWESKTPEVVQVSQDGYISQVNSGFARITATTSQSHIVAEFNVSFPHFIFNMNGHGIQIEPIYTEPYNDDQSSLKPKDPVAEGFTFDGWYTDQALTKIYEWNIKQESDLMLYAKWTEKPGPGPGPGPEPEPEPFTPEYLDSLCATGDICGTIAAIFGIFSIGSFLIFAEMKTDKNVRKKH